jgi:hypothetical protein
MASVNFYLKRPKDKDGEFKAESVQVYLKFSIDRTHRFDLPAGEQIIPKFWDNEKQAAKSKMPGCVEFNQVLARIKAELIQLYRDNKHVDFKVLQEMSRNTVKHGNSAAPSEKKSLITIFDLFLKKWKQAKNRKTVQKYEGLQTKLLAFPGTKHIAAGKDICLEDLDFNFYDAFKEFLFNCPNQNYPGQSLHFNQAEDCWEFQHDSVGEAVGLFDDTVYKYFINLRAVLKWADSRGFTIHPSFKTWEIIKRKYAPISLTMAELERLEQLVITPDIIRQKLALKRSTSKLVSISQKALETARDYLVIECRTGQRISDIKRFEPSGVADFKWELIQRKGDRTSTRHVTVWFKGYCAPALWIFQKHGFKMPKVSEQKLNENIKRVAKLAGIDEHIAIYRWAQNKRVKISGPKYEFTSTHIGRKTFITLALQSMPEKLVRELAGIENYETLKSYEGKSEEQVIERYLNEMQEQTLMKKAQ